jgi:predicted thioesterase
MVDAILKFSVFSSSVSEECADITLLVKGGAASVWQVARYAVVAARPLRELRSRLLFEVNFESEWACIKAVNPHLDWPREQTVGTRIDVSHEAATPPGLEVTTSVELIAVEGKKLTFTVNAHDGVDLISKGRHERFVIDKERFDAKLAAKRL